jgi:monofunctional glycosyltransferase
MRLLGRVLLVIPALAFAGCVYLYLTLPDVRPLLATNPDTTAFMELRAREARAGGQQPRKEHRWVPYGRISPHLRRAVVEAEDSAFWQHGGLDLRQLRESVEVNVERREFARGASTITQQLAKNLYLSPDKTILRKVRELMIARRLEAELSKERILELYLNVIEWGDGIYGAEAAARRYFRKPASQLTVEEAALMAGAVRSPRVLDPSRPSRRLLLLQQQVLRLMGAPRSPAEGSRVQADEAATPAVGVPGQAPAPVPAAPMALPGQVLPMPKPPGGGIPDGREIP